MSSLDGVAEQQRSIVGIAPLEADLEAMRRTLRSLEKAIEERRPEDVVPLISPRISGVHHEAIRNAATSFSATLQRETRYEMRTEIGRGALVPIGPERMQIQIRGTKILNGDRSAGMVHMQLESVEAEGRRQWLLTSLTFPGQQRIIVGGIPWKLILGVGCGFLLLIVILGVWRRRRSQTRES